MDKNRKSTSTKTTEKKETAPPDMLPYVIIFAILTLIVLGLLTWVIGEWYAARQCFTDPNIWCFDTWQCNSNCPAGTPPLDQAGCFTEATNQSGLASCIYGPDSFLANFCFGNYTPTGPTGDTGSTGSTGDTGSTGPTGGPACECLLPQGITNNCMAGCPSDLSHVPKLTVCCCCPKTAGCPWETITQLVNAATAAGTSCGDANTIQNFCTNSPP